MILAREPPIAGLRNIRHRGGFGYTDNTPRSERRGCQILVTPGSTLLAKAPKRSEVTATNNRNGGAALPQKGNVMLYTLAVILIVLWLLGLVTSYTLGGFIHILLVVAVVMVLVDLISGRRAV